MARDLRTPPPGLYQTLSDNITVLATRRRQEEKDPPASEQIATAITPPAPELEEIQTDADPNEVLDALQPAPSDDREHRNGGAGHQPTTVAATGSLGA